MISRVSLAVLAALVTLLPATPSFGKDYLVLKSGQTIECAILKVDTLVVRATDWGSRHLSQPPLQVYTRDEVRSISFSAPSTAEASSQPYARHANLLEFGGGAAFQTWAESKLVRRSLVQLNLMGSYFVTSYLGLELDGGLTIPMGGSADSLWRSYDFGYQTTMNIVGQPVEWRGIVPFAVVGGGAAIGVPTEDVLLTSSTDVRNLVNFGLGIKTGSNGIGFRLEWRHHFYTWTPDEINKFGVRVPEHSADMSAIRASVFLYK